MTATNREWKQFSKQNEHPLGLWKFLLGSMVVHLVLAMLFAAGAKEIADQKEELDREEQRLQEEQKQQKKEVAQQAEQEFKEILKEEVIQQELRDLKEFVEKSVGQEKGEEIWKELIEELQPELQRIAQMFELPEQFDDAAAQKAIDRLKEQMLDRLSDLVLQELMVEFFRRKLVEEVADPAVEAALQQVQMEEKDVLTRLQRAEKELSSALAAGEQAKQQLEKARARLEDRQKALEGATAGKDAKAETQIRTEVKKDRTDLLAAAKTMSGIATPVKTAGEQLGRHAPNSADALKTTGNGSLAEMQKQTQKATSEATEGKPGEAATSLASAEAQLGKTLTDLKKVQEGVRLQTASELVGKLERTLRTSASAVEQQAQEKSAGAKSGDAKRSAKADRELQAIAKKLVGLDAELKQLAQSVEKARETLKGDGATRLEARKVEAVERELQKGRELLPASPKQGAERLREAAKQLAELDRVLQAALREGNHPRDATIAREVNELQRLQQGPLSEQVEKRFAQLYKDKVLPELLNQAKQLDEQRLAKESGSGDLSRAELERLAKERERLLGRETLKEIKAGETIVGGLAKRLPSQETNGDPKRSEGSKSGPERGLERSLELETTIVQTIEKQLAAVLDTNSPALKNLMAGTTGNKAELGRLRAEVEGFRRQLAQGNASVVGRAGRAEIHAMFDRHQERMEGLRRSSSYVVDVEGYRRMVEHIKQRGQITGEEIARTATEEPSRTDQTNEMRPAIVGVPSREPEQPAVKQEERTIKAPGFQTHRYAGVPLVAENAITIDGDLADWKNLPTLELDPVVKGKLKPIVKEPPHQVARLALSPRGLLIAVEAEDTTGEMENDRPSGKEGFWENDGVEIYLDTLNSKSTDRGEPHTHQFYAFPFGHKNSPETAAYESHMLGKGPRLDWKIMEYTQQQIQRRGKRTEKGWNLEMLIPREVLREGHNVRPGKIVGFNIQVDTGSGRFYYWSGAKQFQCSMHPNLWGDMQILGSDGRVEILDPSAKTVVPALVPGSPLTVRVTDIDANVDDKKKDRISATIRTSTGDLESLILEETEERSGVFVGSIATRLNDGSVEKNIVEVFEGEKVIVEYTDRIRAFGERNVPVKATIPVGSLGARLGR